MWLPMSQQMNSSDPPPTNSSAVSAESGNVVLELELKEPLLPASTPSAPPASASPTTHDAISSASAFFAQEMETTPSSLKISHGSQSYANDTEYFIRDSNGSLVFSGTVDDLLVDNLKVIRFKNFDRLSVFVIKLSTPQNLMQIDVCTQEGLWKFASMTNDFKSQEYPKLEFLQPEESVKYFSPIQRSVDDFGLRNRQGNMVATAHIKKTLSTRAQRRNAVAEAKEVEVALNISDHTLDAYEKAAVLAWGLFWVILSRLGERSGQYRQFYWACLLASIFVVVPTIYVFYKL